MADDNLSIEIFVNDKVAEATLAKFRTSLAVTDKAATDVGKTFATGGLSRGLTEASQAALNLSNRSKLASSDALRLYSQLRDIRTAISTSTDPIILKQLRSEAKLALFDLDQLEAKVRRVAAGRSMATGEAGAGGAGMSRAVRAGRVNLARQGADVFTTVGMGQDPWLIAIQQGPQALEAMAQSGIKLSRAMMVSAGVIGGIAIAGAAIVAWTQSVRDAAEQRLKLEEKIQGAINKQALALKSLKDNLANTIEQRNKDAAFAERLASMDLEAVRNRKALLVQLNELNDFNKTPEGLKSREERNTEILALDEQERALAKQKVVSEKAAFDQRFENFKTLQEMERQGEEIREKALEEQKKKIEQLGKTYREALMGITGQTQNPFTQIFLQGSSAVDKLKESLKGVPTELQRIAISAQQSLNSLTLFETRLQNRFDVADLRSLEEKLRETPAEALARFEQQYAQFQQTGHRHPIHEERFQRERERIANIEKFRLQENLDEKIRAASFATTDAERLRAARALVDIARSADPSALRRDQRDDLAAAVRKVSEQKERDEAEARETMKNLAKGVERFNEIVGSPEFKKLQIDVTDKDGRVQSVTNATPDDVTVNYGGFFGSVS